MKSSAITGLSTVALLLVIVISNINHSAADECDCKVVGWRGSEPEFTEALEEVKKRHAIYTAMAKHNPAVQDKVDIFAALEYSLGKCNDKKKCTLGPDEKHPAYQKLKSVAAESEPECAIQVLDDEPYSKIMEKVYYTCSFKLKEETRPHEITAGPYNGSKLKVVWREKNFVPPTADPKEQSMEPVTPDPGTPAKGETRGPDVPPGTSKTVNPAPPAHAETTGPAAPGDATAAPAVESTTKGSSATTGNVVFVVGLATVVVAAHWNQWIKNGTQE